MSEITESDIIAKLASMHEADAHWCIEQDIAMCFFCKAFLDAHHEPDCILMAAVALKRQRRDKVPVEKVEVGILEMDPQPTPGNPTITVDREWFFAAMRRGVPFEGQARPGDVLIVGGLVESFDGEHWETISR